eukprot:9858344-Prorocentrum_lima.AAC.1
MTSSLVGSEMCIRDSYFVQPRRLPLCSTVFWPGKSPPLLCLPFGAVAVSYTHLTLPTICSV